MIFWEPNKCCHGKFYLTKRAFRDYCQAGTKRIEPFTSASETEEFLTNWRKGRIFAANKKWKENSQNLTQSQFKNWYENSNENATNGGKTSRNAKDWSIGPHFRQFYGFISILLPSLYSECGNELLAIIKNRWANTSGIIQGLCTWFKSSATVVCVFFYSTHTHTHQYQPL